MRELAEEKVLGIENELIESDRAVFNRIDIHNILEIKDILDWERPAIESVVILDDQLRIVPGGYFSKRSSDRVERFSTLLLERVVPDLDLRQAPSNVRGHLHTYYDNRSYLFSYMRRQSRGRTFYIVLEVDLVYLVGRVFPQFFDVPSPHLYQVIDEVG
ncbi:MAG: hypothetical protein AAGC55_16895, partial [Myxococcota bacterium]